MAMPSVWTSPACTWALLAAIACVAVFAAEDVSALYEGMSKVVSVTTQAEFEKEVLNNDGVTMVEFYADWCGHCQNLAPEFEKAAAQLSGVVKLVAVNADTHREIAGPYGVQGFPTLKVFKGKKDKSPSDYQGQRTAAAIVTAMLDDVKKLVKGRSGGGGKSKGGSSGGSDNSSEPGGGKHVVTLTAANWDKETGSGKEVWAVEFYAPWCGHCKALAPVWAEAAEKLKGAVKFGAINCDDDANRPVCAEFSVQGFPTIASVMGGKELKKYEGGRDVESIVNWGNTLAEKYGPPPDVNQLFSKKAFDDDCVGKPLCIIGILPNIMDTGADGRNSYIKMMQDAAKKFVSSQWGWMWTEIGQQQKLQDAVGVFDSPAVLAVSMKKKRYSVMKGSFSTSEMANFGRGLSSGRIKTSETEKDIADLVDDGEQWDGKDADMMIEEEFDLNELMNDE